MKALLCFFYQVRYPKNWQKVSSYDWRYTVQSYKVCADLHTKSNDHYIYSKLMSPSENMVLIYIHMSIGIVYKQNWFLLINW